MRVHVRMCACVRTCVCVCVCEGVTKKLYSTSLSMCAALISETPPTVQLTFEPSGKPGKDQEYYLVQKENICVVCGCDKSCIRKNIVPHEYRKLVRECLSSSIIIHVVFDSVKRL